MDKESASFDMSKLLIKRIAYISVFARLCVFASAHMWHGVCAGMCVCVCCGIRGFVCVKEGVCVFARMDNGRVRSWARMFVCEGMSECACKYACVWACERVHAHVKYFTLASTSFKARRGSGFDDIFCIFANMSCLCIHLVTLFNLPCKTKLSLNFFLCRKISFFHHPKVFISVK